MKTRSLIVIVSGAPYDGVQRSAKGLARALSVHGPVLFVDPTTSSRSEAGLDLVTAIRIRPVMHRVSPNLFHLSAVALPGHSRPGIRRVARLAVIRGMRRAVAKIGEGAPRAVFLQTPHLNVLGTLDEATSVYWATDSFTAGSSIMGVDAAALAEDEYAAAAQANLIIAVTERIASMWRGRGQVAVVVKNGVDAIERAQLDTPPPEDLTLPRPIAAVVGTISNRIDFSLMTAVADAGISVAIIGPTAFRTDRSEFDDLCSRPNVEWIGPKPHNQLADYYQCMDVGLVPYTLSEFNRSSAPLKPLEYLAAGLPVVSTDLPGVVAIESPDIAVVDSREQFVDAVWRAIAVSRRAALITRRRSHIDAWSWKQRAQEVRMILDEMLLL